MHRLIVVLIGCAILGAAGHLSRLHTHAYGEHTHQDHQHGLAAHTHDAPAPLSERPNRRHDGDEGVHVESCEPDRHQVSFSVGAVPAATVYAFDADSTATPPSVPQVVVRPVHSVTDVRVHGPPPLSRGPSRAPPQLFPA